MTQVTWRSSDLLRAFALFFAIYVGLRFLWVVKSILLVVILAILFGVTLARGVDYLERWKIRRGLGTFAILLAIFGALAGIAFAIAPTLEKQTKELQQKLPDALKRVEQQLKRKPLANAALQATAASVKAPAATATGQPGNAPAQKPSEPEAGKPGDAETPKRDAKPSAFQSHLTNFTQMIFPFLSNSLAAIAGAIVVVFLAAYFAADPKLYRRGALALVPPAKREQAGELFEELGVLLRQWMLARLAAMVLIGVITGIGLALLKIPAAAALGVIAGLLEFIPFVGPIASAVPAVGMALVVSPSKALYVVLLFVVLQQLEGNLITPLLMKNRLDVPPAVTIIAVASLGVVFGIIGMLVAEPLSAVVMTLVRRLYVDRMNGAGPASAIQTA